MNIDEHLGRIKAPAIAVNLTAELAEKVRWQFISLNLSDVLD